MSEGFKTYISGSYWVLSTVFEPKNADATTPNSTIGNHFMDGGSPIYNLYLARNTASVGDSVGLVQAANVGFTYQGTDISAYFQKVGYGPGTTIVHQATSAGSTVYSCPGPGPGTNKKVRHAFFIAGVGGDLGHLDNEDSADLLSKLDNSQLQHLVAAHLSAKNNTVPLARAALAKVLGCEPEWIGVADQLLGFDWRTIS